MVNVGLAPLFHTKEIYDYQQTNFLGLGKWGVSAGKDF
jgi:hypothetical protein